MRILYYEIRKLFCSKALLMALLALLCVAAFFNVRHIDDSIYSHGSYSSLMNDLDGKSDEEIMEFLQSELSRNNFYIMMEMGAFPEDEIDAEDARFLSDYREYGVQLKYTDFLLAEWRLFNDAYEQCDNVTSYTAHLDYLIEQAERLGHFSIFSGRSNFEKLSIDKTIQAYEKLYDTEPRIIDSVGINALLDFSVRDLMLLFSGILASFILIYDEKRKGTIRLIVVTKNGRFPLALSKAASLLIWVIASSIMLFLSSYLVFYFKYGVMDFSAPIQSVSGYINSTMQISIGGMIAINECIKLLGVYAIVLTLAAMFSNKHSLAWAGIVCAFLGAGGLLYAVIPANSIYNIFKYANVGGLIAFTKNVKRHYNVNLLGIPLNVIYLIVLFLVVMLIISAVIFIFIFTKTRFQNTVWKFDFKRSRPPKISIFRSELYRSIFINGGIYVLIILSAVQVYEYDKYNVPYDENRGYYNEYLQKIDAMSLDEVGVFINAEKQSFERTHEAIEEIEQIYLDEGMDGVTYLISMSNLTRKVAGEDALSLIDEQYEYITTHNNRAKFVDESNLNQIMGVNGLRSEMKGVTLIAISLIMMICPMFLRFSDGENSIIRTTRNGKVKYLTVRLIIVAISCMAVYLILVIPSVMRLLEEVRISDLSGAVQSLAHFRGVEGTYSIGQYIAFAYLIKFAGVIISAASIVIICLISRRSILGYLISALVLVVPILLYFLVDVSFAGFALNRLLTGFGMLL